MVDRYAVGVIEFVSRKRYIFNHLKQNSSQIIWVSPLLPRLRNDIGNDPEKEDFKTDLLNYLSNYNLSQVEKIKEELENFDFSQVKIRLVASIPGNGFFIHSTISFPRKVSRRVTNQPVLTHTVWAIQYMGHT